jgi:hypothetical protein
MDLKQLIREKIGKLEVASKENYDVGLAIDDNIKFLIQLLGQDAQLELNLPTEGYQNVFQEGSKVSGGMRPINYTAVSEAELLLVKTLKGE